MEQQGELVRKMDRRAFFKSAGVAALVAVGASAVVPEVPRSLGVELAERGVVSATEIRRRIVTEQISMIERKDVPLLSALREKSIGKFDVVEWPTVITTWEE